MVAKLPFIGKAVPVKNESTQVFQKTRDSPKPRAARNNSKKEFNQSFKVYESKKICKKKNVFFFAQNVISVTIAPEPPRLARATRCLTFNFGIVGIRRLGTDAEQNRIPFSLPAERIINLPKTF